LFDLRRDTRDLAEILEIGGLDKRQCAKAESGSD
jgi:hypothetical protein